MCWSFTYRIGFTNLEKMDEKFDDSERYDSDRNYGWKEVDSAQKMIELCRKIGADIPESIAEFAVSGEDSCLCLLTEEEKQVTLGRIALYAINQCRLIEMDWN
jgi:hypothetical protein